MWKRILIAAGVLVIVAAVVIAYFLATRSPEVNVLAKPGELRWKAKLGNSAYGANALNDVVVAYRFSIWGFGKRKVHAYDAATGKRLWAKMSANSAGGLTPDVVSLPAGALVVFPNYEHPRQAFDLRTGEVWLEFPEAVPPVYGAFAIDFDRLCIYGNSNGLAFSSRDSIAAFSPARNALEWTYAQAVITSQVVSDGTRVYFGALSGGPKFTAVNLADGKEAWSVSTGNEMAFHAAAGDAAVCYSRPTGSGLHVFDAATGMEKWALPPPTMYYSPVIAGGRLYVGDIGGCHAYSIADGNEIWAYAWPWPSRYASLSVRGGSVYCATMGALVVLDADTGKERWRFQVEGMVAWRPAVSGDTVYFTTEKGWLYAVAIEPEGQNVVPQTDTVKTLR